MQATDPTWTCTARQAKHGLTQQAELCQAVLRLTVQSKYWLKLPWQTKCWLTVQAQCGALRANTRSWAWQAKQRLTTLAQRGLKLQAKCGPGLT